MIEKIDRTLLPYFCGILLLARELYISGETSNTIAAPHLRMVFSPVTSRYALKNRTNKDFNVTSWLYPHALKQPHHSHSFASFSFVSAGNYRERFGRKTHERRPSTVVFHPPGESHAVAFETNVQILSVKISFEKLSTIREQMPALDSPESCRTETIAELGARVYRELNRTDAASALAIEGLILEIIAEGARGRADRETAFPGWLRETKDYLHDNFADTFSLDAVAAVARVHPGHLARVFREKMGCTIGEYVRRLRLETSKRAVLEGRARLSDIASSAGFFDQSHFNRVFKSTYGLTPMAYRRKHSDRGK